MFRCVRPRNTRDEPLCPAGTLVSPMAQSKERKREYMREYMRRRRGVVHLTRWNGLHGEWHLKCDYRQPWGLLVTDDPNLATCKSCLRYN